MSKTEWTVYGFILLAVAVGLRLLHLFSEIGFVTLAFAGGCMVAHESISGLAKIFWPGGRGYAPGA
jgi:hypothetical protein